MLPRLDETCQSFNARRGGFTEDWQVGHETKTRLRVERRPHDSATRSSGSNPTAAGQGGGRTQADGSGQRRESRMAAGVRLLSSRPGSGPDAVCARVVHSRCSAHEPEVPAHRECVSAGACGHRSHTPEHAVDASSGGAPGPDEGAPGHAAFPAPLVTLAGAFRLSPSSDTWRRLTHQERSFVWTDCCLSVLP